MSHLIQPVQIVLVYDNAATFDQHFGELTAIEPRMKAAVHDFGTWQSLPGYNTPNHLGLATDKHHITFQRYDEKMGLGGFSDVLANPLIASTKPGLTRAIKDHQRAFLIEVGCGSVPGFAASLLQSGITDKLGDMKDLGIGAHEDQTGYENRLLLAQTLTSAIINEMAPSAVHWVQSQQLFDGPTFQNLAAEGFSTLLYCGPFIFGGKKLANGTVLAGVRAFGSQAILGKMVMFKPDPQDWLESYKQILHFIAYCRHIGRVLDDNETISGDTPDAPVIRVTHKNDIPQLVDGYIELSLDGRNRSAMKSGFIQRLFGIFSK